MASTTGINNRQALELAGRHGPPVLFLSEGRVRRNYRSLRSALPGVDLYYAAKANPHPDIVRILTEERAFFDVCTNGEIDIVHSCGVAGDRCLHTHPVKQETDLRHALDFGIDTFVADNHWELEKLVPYKDRLKVLIRLCIENPHCPVNLSRKFGVQPSRAATLVTEARDMGLTVEGLAFHVGSQNQLASKYIEALQHCTNTLRAVAKQGIELRTIDIGGGFPISYLSPTTPIARYCRPIRDYLAERFAGYRIIAEPGRFVCGGAMVLATRVIGKSVRQGVRWYYLDEGLYGSFSGKVFDHADYPMYVSRGGKRYPSTIAGPTCDSFDVPYENVPLPELEIGDILLFGSMGAYTTASATTFNGYPLAKTMLVA
jgi:ornithine decarboxylase